MANVYTIDKLDARTKKALVKDILAGKPTNQLAKIYSVDVACIHRYKTSKLFKAVAEVWNEKKGEIAREYETQLATIADKLNKTLDAIDSELDKNHTGNYDLSDPARASHYVKMLNDTSRSLQANLLTLAKISGDIKETVEIQNRPTSILSGIGELLGAYATTDIVRNDIVNCLKRLASDRREAELDGRQLTIEEQVRPELQRINSRR